MSMSEKKNIHLSRLQTLPQVIENRFKKGQKAHNKNGIIIPCSTCGKELYRTQCRLKHAKNQYCSRDCADTGKLSPLRQKIIELYKEGKKYKEIAIILNKPIGSVAFLISNCRLRERWGKGLRGSRHHVLQLKKKLPTGCELCGFDRFIELAHIVPRRSGGKIVLHNVVILCPNHHRLYDNDRLIKEEKDKLDEIINLRKNLGLAEEDRAFG